MEVFNRTVLRKANEILVDLRNEMYDNKLEHYNYLFSLEEIENACKVLWKLGCIEENKYD